MLIEEEAEDVMPSTASMLIAEEIISSGLNAAMNAKQQTPADIWAEFELLRRKMQSQVQKSEKQAQNQTEFESA